MNGVSLGYLEALYADTDDPWDFRGSTYEQAKFRATLGALPRSRYAAVLEIGCGNGELARHLQSRCAQYCGVDAVETALAAARAALPDGRFYQIFLPARLPEGRFDLILMSEILYFLDPGVLLEVAGQIRTRWPAADVLCVNWQGPTGHPLSGAQAFDIFAEAIGGSFRRVARNERYTIDLRRGAG